MRGIPRPVLGAAVGAIVGTVSVLFIITYHPFMKIPMEYKDVLSTIWTGLLSIGGGMLAQWRVERAARKLKEEESSGT